MGHKATAEDLGIVPGKVGSDCRLGLLAFFAVLAPTYAAMFAAMALLPKNAVADPIPLFVLALALGALYYRTHRILPCIVVHVAFNATAVISAIYLAAP